ncbi:hypothetical protein [Psychroserpens algicola]|uniref:hypothetical protein n=1 Tax=Psychroserpens algicola TaxID=1719034 RepID=UPI001954E37B|nr:hypothetical protein [Psychroserpens algicola]
MKTTFSIMMLFMSMMVFAQVQPNSETEVIEIETIEEHSEKETEVPFVVVENVPIYKGCDDKLSNAQLKKCMSDKIGRLVGTEFDSGLASRLGLPPGKVRIITTFKIDKEGKVINIQARAARRELEKEAKRVIALIPDLEKPGIHKGEPVVVSYSLPIVFAVTGNNTKEKKN